MAKQHETDATDVSVALNAARSGGRMQKLVGAVISVVILCLALWFLRHELSNRRNSIPFSFHDTGGNDMCYL